MDKKLTELLDSIHASIQLNLPIQVAETAASIKKKFNAAMRHLGQEKDYMLYVAPPAASGKLAGVMCYIAPPGKAIAYADELDNIVHLYAGREGTLDVLVSMYRIGLNDPNETPLNYQYVHAFPTPEGELTWAAMHGVVTRNIIHIDEEIIEFLLDGVHPH